MLNVCDSETITVASCVDIASEASPYFCWHTTRFAGNKNSKYFKWCSKFRLRLKKNQAAKKCWTSGSLRNEWRLAASSSNLTTNLCDEFILLEINYKMVKNKLIFSPGKIFWNRTKFDLLLEILLAKRQREYLIWISMICHSTVWICSALLIDFNF